MSTRSPCRRPKFPSLSQRIAPANQLVFGRTATSEINQVGVTASVVPFQSRQCSTLVPVLVPA
jgi:hypothetical protein